MRIKVFRWLSVLVFVLVITLLISTATPLFADTTATVTVTNTPQFIGITVDNTTFTMNSLTGNSHVMVNTTYYSNPQGDTVAPSATVAWNEAHFRITSTSNVAINLTANSSDMSGGSDNSANGNTGTAGATSYGAYTYWSGVAFASKVLMKSSASGVAYSNLAASGTKDFGFQLSEQTNDWVGSTAATFTITVTAAAY